MLHKFSDVTQFRHDTLNFLTKKGAGSNSALVKLELGFKPVYLVADPTVGKQVLKAEEVVIAKGRLIRTLREVIGYNMLTMSGDEHKRRREAVHREFSRGVGGSYVQIMEAVIAEWLASVGKAGEFDAHKATAALALRVISSLVFGKGVLTPGDESVLTEAVALAENDLADKVFQVFPNLPWVHIRKQRRLAAARKMMAVVVKRARKSASASSLIRAYETMGLNESEIHDEILLMLLAGHHTAGSAMAWLLYHIAVNPEISRSLMDEARACVNDVGEITAASIRRAPISKALVQEVLRLYPPAYYMSREIMRTQELAGVKLHKGTSLIIAPWIYHRDAKKWENPESFDINRDFSGEYYMPFGLGPRACVGLGVAMLELQLLALEFAAALDVTIVRNTRLPTPKASITLLPPSIIMRVEPCTCNIKKQNAA